MFLLIAPFQLHNFNKRSFLQKTHHVMTSPSFGASYNFDELSEIIKDGNSKKIETVKNLGLVNSELKTLLHVSAQEKQKEISKYLLEKGLNPDQKDAKGKSAFAYACLTEDENLINLFLEYKPNVNTQDNLGNTPAHKAIKNMQVLKILLDNGANPYVQNEFGLPLLHMAKNNLETADFLLKRKINPNSINEDGQSLLHTAASEGRIELIKKLISYNAEVNFKDNENNTPLFFAKNPFVIQELVDNGSKVNITNKKGETPLGLFFKRKNKDNIEALLKNGANSNEKYKNEKPFLYYCDQPELAELFLGHGANPNDDFYLHYALMMKKDDLFDLFLKYGADSNKKADNGRTPLFYCTSTEQIKKLLDAKSEINVKDDNENTPLHNFMLIGRKDLADFLVEQGADINLKNRNGETPSDYYEKWKKYNFWIK